jgi:predicted ATPase/DNA-binding CsgD family transcriptional regulator
MHAIPDRIRPDYAKDFPAAPLGKSNALKAIEICVQLHAARCYRCGVPLNREVTMAQVVSRSQVTGSRRLGLLPTETTSFVGRTMELAGITALLRTTRMVTVTGPGGVGKTRTSLLAAEIAADQYQDGAWFADLSEIADPDRVAGVVAAALGVSGDNEAAKGAALLGHLCGKQLLLVLDTCEHLVDACGALADTVLRTAPGVTLLATSQQPLDTPGEHAFPLLPLPAEADAVDLFTQRAAAVIPGFAVTAQNRADVVRVCRRLDGIPLAIELAAVRLRALPLTELASQLEFGIRTLTVRRRGTTPRHQTLRALMDWSYRLCTPHEQALWARLSVFAETFDVSAAEQVCAGGPLPREQVLHALIGLVDKSVVLRDGADSSRYRLPAALREFGADRLAEADAVERFHGRLATWSLTLATDFDEAFRGGGDAELAAAFRRLHREYDSVAVALDWALAPQEPRDAVTAPAEASSATRRRGIDLAARLCCYWQLSGRFDEGRQWLGLVASLFPETEPEYAWALGERGQLAAYQGDPAAALADISESVRLAAAAGRDAEPAAAHGYLRLSVAFSFAGRTAEALAAAETARQRLPADRHRTLRVALEAQLAHLQQLAGRVDEAISCCDRGLKLLHEPALPLPGRERQLRGYLHLLSGLALLQWPGNERASARALRRALASGQELGDVLATAFAVEALAWLAARRNQHERAAWLLGAADQLWARTGRRLSGIARMEESRQQAAMTSRRSLGDRRYTAAYAYGTTLSLEVVVRDATDQPDERDSRCDDIRERAGGGQAAGGADSATATLTRREREIADLVASGLSNREIATRLFISKRTVDAHVDHIFSKLKISSRVQLTVLLREPAKRAAAARGQSAGPTARQPRVSGVRAGPE